MELLDLTAKQFVILDSLCFRVQVRLKSHRVLLRDPVGPVELHIQNQGDPLRGGRTRAQFPGSILLRVSPRICTSYMWTIIQVIRATCNFLLLALSLRTALANCSFASLLQSSVGKFSVVTMVFIYLNIISFIVKWSPRICYKSCLHKLSKYFLLRARRTSVK